MGKQNVILQMYATVWKQPMSLHSSCDQWEWGTLPLAHPWYCRRSPQPRNSQWHYTVPSTNGIKVPTHLGLILDAADGRHSPETTNSMRVLYSVYSSCEGTRHLTFSSSLMLQTVATAQKQPIAWQYTIQATNGNVAPYLELILDAADRRTQWPGDSQ